MINPGNVSSQVIYQADPASLNAIHQHRDHLHGLCSQYMNKPVMVEMTDGQRYEGTIVRVEKSHLYLKVKQYPANQGPNRFFPFFGSPGFHNDEVIMTLVLFELLVITLLLTA